MLYTIVTQWEEPPRARHQVANELKVLGKVYFVERNKFGFPRIEIKQVEENVFVITPYYFINYKARYRLETINNMYHEWLLKKIKNLNIEFELVITFDYTAPAIHNYFNNVIFYLADDNVGFGKFNPAWINRYHERTEKEVAQRANLCIATSDYMGKKIGAYNLQTHVIPLGAPEIKIEPFTVSQNKKGLPVLGLVGFLDSNMDEALLFKILGKFTVLMIGPANKKNIERLSAYQNAKILGVKTGKALADALKEADVCIAPYDINKLNKGATPNKFWLYLAVGKPAVITTMPNIENWRFEDKLVYKCTNDSFIEKCIEAYNDDTTELALKRIELARNSSWQKRVKSMLELFYKVSAEKTVQKNLSEATLS
ncbi:hypothetical protein BH09BAC2_BH09BAC2_18120 [soil metagenome]